MYVPNIVDRPGPFCLISIRGAPQSLDIVRYTRSPLFDESKKKVVLFKNLYTEIIKKGKTNLAYTKQGWEYCGIYQIDWVGFAALFRNNETN